MFKVEPGSALGRFVQWATSYRWFTHWVGPRFVQRLDRWLYRLSGGRILLASLILDSLLLTTTGRKSGLERTVPIAYFRVDGEILIVGSNFGQPRAPAWSLNLLADARAHVVVDGREHRDVVAVRLAPEEREAAWPAIIARWSPFGTYRETVGDREIEIFRLDPA